MKLVNQRYSNDQKSIKHINKLSKSKLIMNQISFRILQKNTLQKNRKINERPPRLLDT